MRIKPKWDSKSVGKYERSLTLKEVKVEQQPQRQWVGLTDDERCSFVNFYWEKDLLSLFELLGIVEAKLKEKNT